MDKYILDSCALLAHVYDETGADIVETLIDKASTGMITVYINKLNLYEAYYDVLRSVGLKEAEQLYKEIQISPIKIIDGISDHVFRKAALLKTRYRISLADSIALGESFAAGTRIVTSDHHEFDIIEENEDIDFLWIR